MQYLLGIMMFLTALFLILLVLIQRGRGGGLAGAFGGAGGQSAFGTKAGDMFTKITIGTAFVWIVIAAASVRFLNAPKTSVLGDGSEPTTTTIAPFPGPDEGDAGTGDGADVGNDAGLLGDALEDAGLLKGKEGTPATGAETDETSPAQPDGGGEAGPATDGAATPATPASEPPATETPAPPAADSAPGE